MAVRIDEEALPLNEDVELEPGFIVRRRCLLGLIPATACMATGFLSAPSHAASTSRGRLSFDKFLAKANPLAGSLVQDKSREGQDTYLFSLAALAARLSDAPEPVSWNDSGQSDRPGTFIGFNPGGEEFTVLQWRLEPNTRIRYHAHTYGNVVTIGLEGAARVRNFEVAGDGDYDFGHMVRLRMTNDQLLLPRKVNLVSLAHNYIHGFEAGPEGARGLDITTRIKPKQKTPFFRLRSEPEGLERQVEAMVEE